MSCRIFSICFSFNLFRFKYIKYIKYRVAIHKIKGIKIVIFKLIFLSNMSTNLYFYFYHAKCIAMLYLVHKYKIKLESTNMVLTYS